MPKVSVIILTYNRAESLRSAVTSVLNQTFQDFEIIVVDDASKDNTREVVRAFDDKRIRYIRHDTNKKEAGSRNTGVTSSKGEYIAFLDDDDEWLPDKLKRQVDLLDSSAATVGCVYTGFVKIDKTTGKILAQIIPTKRGNVFLDMATQNWVGTSTVLLRKECLEKVGLFDESIAFGLDYDMWIRISKEFEFDYIKEPLVNYFVHETMLSTNYGTIIKGMEGLHRKYGSLFALNKRNYSGRYLYLGILYCYNGNPRKGREAFFKAIQLYPLDIRHYYNLCLSLLGTDNYKKGNELKERITSPIRSFIMNYISKTKATAQHDCRR